MKTPTKWLVEGLMIVLCAAVSILILGFFSGCSGPAFSEESWQLPTGGSGQLVGTTGGQSSALSTGPGSSAPTGGAPAQSSGSLPAATGGALSISTGATTGGSGLSSTGGATGIQTSSIQARPCDGFCPNPVVFDLSSGNYASPALGTGQSCWETLAALAGGVQSNFAVERWLYVNGIAATPSQWSLPAPLHGGYCILVRPGPTANAVFSVW
jgi:hypothetical protein